MNARVGAARAAYFDRPPEELFGGFAHLAGDGAGIRLLLPAAVTSALVFKCDFPRYHGIKCGRLFNYHDISRTDVIQSDESLWNQFPQSIVTIVPRSKNQHSDFNGFDTLLRWDTLIDTNQDAEIPGSGL